MILERESRFWMYFLAAMAVHAAVLAALGLRTSTPLREETFRIDLRQFQEQETSRKIEFRAQRTDPAFEPTTPPPPPAVVQSIRKLPLPEKRAETLHLPPETTTYRPKRVLLQPSTEPSPRMEESPLGTAPETEAPAASTDDLRAAYLAAVRHRILSHKKYPRLAVRREEQGAVKLRFRVHRNGSLIRDPEVAASSGYVLLDGEAVRCVRSSAPHAPFPHELPDEHLDLVIVIDFQLKDAP